MSKVESDVVEYLWVGNVMDTEQVTSCPVDHFNSLELSGGYPHEPRWKIWVLKLLLHNLDVPRLCNTIWLQNTHLSSLETKKLLNQVQCGFCHYSGKLAIHNLNLVFFLTTEFVMKH